MKIETEKKNICVNRLVSQKKERIILEEDVIIPDIKPDILKPISSNGNVCISKQEVLEGKIRLEGNVEIYIMYLADSERDNIRGINTSISFKELIDCQVATSKMKIDAKVVMKSIECKVLNGRKVSIKVELEADTKLYYNDVLNIVSDTRDIKDIQTIKNKIKLNSVVGSNNTKAYAKETIKINSEDNLAEILRADFSIINKDIKISYNKILAKADINVKMIYLTEDNRIRSVEEKIPVMGFIEMMNISEEDICEVRYLTKNILIKPNSEEEHSVYVEIELELICDAFKEEEIELIEDLYSPTRNLKYDSRDIVTIIDKSTRNEIYEINERISIKELEGERLTDIRVTPMINNVTVSRGKIIYDGEVKADFMMTSNNQSTVESITKMIPYIYSVENDDITEESRVDTSIDVIMQDFVLDDSEVTINIRLNFEINKYNQLNMNIIEEIEEGEDRTNMNPYSMTIYFVKPGDTLWKIAKRHRSTIDDIVRLNKIEKNSEIDVGMQLFIPKYVGARNN